MYARLASLMVTREPLTIRYSNPLGPQSRNISQGRSPQLPKTHVTIKLNRHATRNVLCPQQRSSSAPSRTRTTDYAVECELRCRHALRKGSRARKIQAGAPTIALTRVVADASCDEHGGRARESRPRRRRLPPTPGWVRRTRTRRSRRVAASTGGPTDVRRERDVRT